MRKTTASWIDKWTFFSFFCLLFCPLVAIVLLIRPAVVLMLTSAGTPKAVEARRSWRLSPAEFLSFFFRPDGQPRAFELFAGHCWGFFIDQERGLLGDYCYLRVRVV